MIHVHNEEGAKRIRRGFLAYGTSVGASLCLSTAGRTGKYVRGREEEKDNEMENSRARERERKREARNGVKRGRSIEREEKI